MKQSSIIIWTMLQQRHTPWQPFFVSMSANSLAVWRHLCEDLSKKLNVSSSQTCWSCLGSWRILLATCLCLCACHPSPDSITGLNKWVWTLEWAFVNTEWIFRFLRSRQLLGQLSEEGSSHPEVTVNTMTFNKSKTCKWKPPYIHSYTSKYPKVSGLSHNEINNNKHSLRSNTKGYGGKTH